MLNTLNIVRRLTTGIPAHAGRSVLKAARGEDALARLATAPKPDLVITDLDAAKLNGVDLIRTPRMTRDLRGATGSIVTPAVAADLLQAVKRVAPGA